MGDPFVDLLGISLLPLDNITYLRPSFSLPPLRYSIPFSLVLTRTNHPSFSTTGLQGNRLCILPFSSRRVIVFRRLLSCFFKGWVTKIFPSSPPLMPSSLPIALHDYPSPKSLTFYLYFVFLLEEGFRAPKARTEHSLLNLLPRGCSVCNCCPLRLH